MRQFLWEFLRMWLFYMGCIIVGAPFVYVLVHFIWWLMDMFR